MFVSIPSVVIYYGKRLSPKTSVTPLRHACILCLLLKPLHPLDSVLKNRRKVHVP